MSYGIGLHFKHVKNTDEILTLIKDIQKEERKEANVRELLNGYSDIWLCSIYKKSKDLDLTSSEISKSYLFSSFLQDLFAHRFYYWPKYNLLAVLYMSEKLPEYMAKYFDGFIYFQSSCDQDYDYKEWDILGDWVKPLIAKAQALSPEEVYKALYNEEPVDKDDLRNSEYQQRVLVYKYIEEALDIYGALYSQESDKFIHIMPSVSFHDDNYDLQHITLKCLEAKLQENEELLETCSFRYK